jgi:hypothetical protein
MSRWRVTLRGPMIELRGWIDDIDVGAFARAMEPFGLVIVSPAEPDYDPFDSAPGQDVAS